MDILNSYRNVIQETISEYAKNPYSHGEINRIVIVSEDRNHFLLMNEGWDGKKHIHCCLIHAQILDDKIWIHFDGTEDGITDELVAGGVPKDKIVLAFHPPSVRQHTGYAIA